jgi:hypothetical protein
VAARAHQVEHAQILKPEGVTRRHRPGLFNPAGYRIEQKMNTQAAETPVQWLLLDLNAFFASCEQPTAVEPFGNTDFGGCRLIY